MKISLAGTVPNKIDPDNSENLEFNLPITSLKSFTPDEVAKNVPKLRALLTLRTLLTEMESNMGNSKDLRKLVAELYSNEEAFSKLREDLKGFEGLKLPDGKAAAVAE